MRPIRPLVPEKTNSHWQKIEKHFDLDWKQIKLICFSKKKKKKQFMDKYKLKMNI